MKALFPGNGCEHQTLCDCVSVAVIGASLVVRVPHERPGTVWFVGLPRATSLQLMGDGGRCLQLTGLGKQGGVCVVPYPVPVRHIWVEPGKSPAQLHIPGGATAEALNVHLLHQLGPTTQPGHGLLPGDPESSFILQDVLGTVCPLQMIVDSFQVIVWIDSILHWLLEGCGFPLLLVLHGAWTSFAHTHVTLPGRCSFFSR